MNLLPFGRGLPVHCCCDPTKRLGWVPVQRERAGHVVFIAGYPSRDLFTGVVTEPERIHTEIAVLEDGARGAHLAVKSGDVPIDTWRKVPGWVEDRGPRI